MYDLSACQAHNQLCPDLQGVLCTQDAKGILVQKIPGILLPEGILLHNDKLIEFSICYPWHRIPASLLDLRRVPRLNYGHAHCNRKVPVEL